MRGFLNIFLLLLLVALPACANPSVPPQTTFTLSSFEIVTTGSQLHKQIPSIAIQLRQAIYRTSLTEILLYQFLSLAFVASLFHLNTDQ